MIRSIQITSLAHRFLGVADSPLPCLDKVLQMSGSFDLSLRPSYLFRWVRLVHDTLLRNDVGQNSSGVRLLNVSFCYIQTFCIRCFFLQLFLILFFSNGCLQPAFRTWSQT